MLDRKEKAIYSILISVLPARTGNAWYSMNMLEREHILKVVLSMASSIQLSSSKFEHIVYAEAGFF